MNQAVDFSTIRNITVSGRIASGSTTLAQNLSRELGWKHIEGGEVFWEAIREKMGVDTKDTHLRPDEEDVLFDAKLKKMLREEKNIIIEAKLAGFNAQGIEGVFKILVVCENLKGDDQTHIRIDRLMNREGKNVDGAKDEVVSREKSDIEKWGKLYALGDSNWVYWDKKYYDLIINTYSFSATDSTQAVLKALNFKK